MKKTTRTQGKSGQHLKKREGESAVMAKIAEMPGHYRAMGERLHDLIKANTPVLSPRTWYGMPAYATDGKVICFFRGDKNERYMTMGFSENANLDEGNMWPSSFALKELTAVEEKKIAELVKKAVS